MDIFQRLQDWLDLKDKSLGWLASEAGCSRSKLSRAIRGLQPLPIEDMLAIQDITGIKPSEWTDWHAERARRGAAQKKSPAHAAEAA